MSKLKRTIESYAAFDPHISDGFSFPTGCQFVADAKADIATLAAENERLREAMTPSDGTKAAYIGEFTMPFLMLDEDGNGNLEYPYVPWTTIKEIMSAIRDRASAALKEG